MGTAALIFPVGSIPISSFNMYTLAILCVALAGAFAAPEAEPVADAHYLYRPLVPYVGVAGHPGYASSYVARSPQGLRGKREAEADAHYGYGLYGRYGYGYHPYGYGYRYPFGYARW